ncbi:MAG: acyl-CoA dehydrogenase [Gemmatimonadales bacterium]|nr:acyl-CoA dehydrogenase [Gemmatimonadales bacterium]
MDFSLSSELAALRDRTREFIRDEVIPFERDPRRTAHGPTDDLRRELNAKARAAGLLAPHVEERWGGLGLGHVGRAVIFEEAGYSMLGPVALHCAAPDEGNMHLMSLVATPAQQERWLKPLATAEGRSCFCMTEPAPGAGADPGALQTTAVAEGDEFVINGRKWLITGAEGAAFAIIMARTLVDGKDVGATMFLTDLPARGFRIERLLDSMDSSFTGGHAEVVLENVRIPRDDVLGEVGAGFRYAQVRLVPARLTHCMRWLGAARRAHDIATQYATQREAFGQPIIRHEGVGFMLADNEIDLHTARLAIWHTAWLLDQGERASRESSMVKVHCSEAYWRVVDRSMQVLGGLGVTDDTEMQRIFRDVRAFRIYDGPSEVHRWSVARRLEGGRKS